MHKSRVLHKRFSVGIPCCLALAGASELARVARDAREVLARRERAAEESCVAARDGGRGGRLVKRREVRGRHELKSVERARIAIDRNDYREGQRRVCLYRLMGELYNYKLMDSSMVFRVLFTVLPRDAGKWGNVMPLTHVGAHLELRDAVVPTARTLVHPKEPMGDGPDDCSRLRAACALLEVCVCPCVRPPP